MERRSKILKKQFLTRSEDGKVYALNEYIVMEKISNTGEPPYMEMVNRELRTESGLRVNINEDGSYSILAGIDEIIVHGSNSD